MYLLTLINKQFIWRIFVHTNIYFLSRPRDTNKFKVVINVAPLSEVTFYLTYNEILQRRRGYYDHTIYINPRQIVDDFRIEVYIQESREITLLRVPPLRNDILSTYNTAGMFYIWNVLAQ